MTSNGPSVNELDCMYKDVEQQFYSPFGTQPQAPPPIPIIIVISGSSGVGKDAVIKVVDCLAGGMDVLLRLDVQGAATIRKILGSNAVFIYLVAESEAALVRRLIYRRTETKDKLVLRIATAREELKHLGDYDYVVVNADGELDDAVSLISSIIDAEKARVHQRVARL